MENEYKHHYEFRMRPYDDKWCIVTMDNKCHDLTVATDLDEPLAEWMCKALNLGIQIEKLNGLDHPQWDAAAWNARAGAPDMAEVERLVDALKLAREYVVEQLEFEKKSCRRADSELTGKYLEQIDAALLRAVRNGEGE